MKKLIVAGLLIVAAGLGTFTYCYWPQKPLPDSVSAMTFAPYPSQKVVYHIAGGVGLLNRNFDQPLGNIANHVKAFGSNPFTLKVVINGDGIAMLKRAVHEKHLSDRVDALRAKGVVFEVCFNTLKERGIDPDTELYGVKRADIIASGVAEVAMLESQGYVYMKP